MPQEFAQAQSESSQQHNDDEQIVTPTGSEECIDILDAVLNDIETTLETNAQEYVNSFVQKGGE